MESETIDSLRVHVRRGLDRFCLGQYFTEYGLQESVKLIPDDVDTDDLEACGLMDKKCPFQVFLKAVASEIVKEKGVTKGRKKRIKDYLEILQAFSSEWVDYIRKNMRKKHQAALKKQNALGSTDAAGADSTSTPLKKKGKRGPRGPYKKRKQAAAPAAASPAMSTPSPRKRSKVPPADMETARREFEKERDETMAKVPIKNKRLFNQVGFAKWGKTSLPAMSLDPYSVPPGDIRDQWMKMFQNVVHKDRISKMGHLVWWIGPQTDGQSSYSVVPTHGFMPYEEGAQRGMHELPSKIKRAMERGQELNKAQQETMETLSILNELALQPKEEREHPRSDFTEEDYWGIDDDEEAPEEELEPAPVVEEERNDDNDDDEEEEELIDDEEDLIDSSLEGASRKKKKGKKRKKDQIINEEEDDHEDQTEIVYDDIEEVVPAEAGSGPPKKRKKKDKAKQEKGKKKKKKKSVEGENMDDDNSNKPVDEKAEDAWDPSATMEAREGEAQQDMDAEAAAGSKPDEDMGMDEASAGSADSALVDSDYGGDEFAGDTDEQLVDDEEPATTSKKKDKKVKKKGSKAKDKAVKEEIKEKKAKKKKHKDKKDKAPKEPKRKSKAAEQRDLEMCEAEYLPFIEELKMAKEKKDIKSIQKVLEKLLPIAESFTASFFSEYEIPKIMKQTKTVVEEAGDGDISTYRKLWNKMKNSYNQKFKELPEGFKPKKRKGIKTPPKDSSERGSEDEPSEKATTAVKEEPHGSPGRTTEASNAAPDAAESAPDVSPSSPFMKVPIKEGKRRLSTGSIEQVLKTVEKAPPAKPKPKKFSIMGLVSKSQSDSSKRLSGGGGTVKSATTPSSGLPKKKVAPSWVTAPLPSSFDSFLGSDRREDRMFALEFLLQAAAHFPSNKGVNEESVARSLEMAIYEWSQSQRGSWADVYWDKVHAIVAAITGKREIGTLVEMIMEGSFASPKSLVKLSMDDLELSFEARPIVLSGE